MTDTEAHQEHAVITQAELDRLRAELAECRRIVRKYTNSFTTRDRSGECRECRMRYGHSPDCPWQKAMGEA